MPTFSHKGYDINLLSDGRFECSRGDFQARGETLKSVQEAIDKEIKSPQKRKLSIAVIGIYKTTSYSNKSKLVGTLGKGVLTGVNRTTREMQFEGLPANLTLLSVMPDTPENEALLLDYIAAKEKHDDLNQKRHALAVEVGGYGRIEAGKYDAILNELEKSLAPTVSR